MNRIFIALSLSIIIAGNAFCQYSGQLSTPGTLKHGQSTAGVNVGIYDGAIGVLGQYRYGVGGFTDIGFKLALMDLDRGPDHSAGIDGSFDFKYQILEKRLHDPIELSAGGVGEFLVVEDFNMLSMGAYVVGSNPILLRNGHLLEPYGRLLLRFERSSVRHYGSDTDFEIGFNLGTAFEFSKKTKAFGEFQFDDPFGFFLGLEFGL